ncbi:MAG: hypothetical protein V4607_02090 [Pseudomonadota bacterium]
MHKHHLISIIGFSMAHAMLRNQADTAGNVDAETQPNADAAASVDTTTSTVSVTETVATDGADATLSVGTQEQSNADAGDEQPEKNKAEEPKPDTAKADAALAAFVEQKLASPVVEEVTQEDETQPEPPVAVESAPEATPLPLYQSHKRVHAMKVGRIEGCTLFPHDESSGIAPITVSPEYITRNNLNQPGYYVLYEDGYESFSPAQAFEEGYRVVTGAEVEDYISCLAFSRETPQHIVDMVESSVRNALAHFGIHRPESA